MSANEPGQPAAPPSPATSWTLNLDVPASALAIGAHPDDVEFGCGATLAKWAANGCTVHHLVCTDGSKGTWDPHADIVALAARRRDEQREAARRLAAANRAAMDGTVHFLGYVDGELASDLDARERVARVVREVRPEVVLGHDPWKRYRLHPDHRHAGLLTCDGIVAARDPHFFPHHGVPAHRPRALLLWEADAPDHVEDVTAWVDAKLHALEAHESQFESTMKALDEAQLAGFRERIRTRLADLGRPHDLAAAEVFKLMTDL
jgi:LmbE family N-acetylglucosaminyl deacetylase